VLKISDLLESNSEKNKLLVQQEEITRNEQEEITRNEIELIIKYFDFDSPYISKYGIERLLEIEENEYIFETCFHYIQNNYKTRNRLTEFRKVYSKVKIVYAKNNRYNNITNITSIDKQLKCGRYTVDDNGIYLNTNKQIIEICSSVIIPHRFFKCQAENKILVEVLIIKDEKKYYLIKPMDFFIDKKKISTLSCYEYFYVTNDKELSKYMTTVIDLNYAKLEKKIYATQMGFNNNEFIPYSDKIICYTNNNFHISESIHEQGDYKTWLDCITKICNNEKIFLTFSATIASVIVGILKLQSFIVNLHGKTSTGKTVALYATASFWGDFNYYVASANMTNNAIINRCSTLNNLPLIIDDTNTNQSKKNNGYDDLIYELASGINRGRCNPDGTEKKTLTWSNITIINGEGPMIKPNSDGGAVNRLIEINTNGEELIENKDNIVEILKENFGFGGKIFIEYIKNIDKKEILSSLRKIREPLKNKFSSKQLDMMSVLYYSMNILNDLFFKFENIISFENLCDEYLKNDSDVSKDERLYEWILNDIAVNYKHFLDKERGVYGYEAVDIWGEFCRSEKYASYNQNILRQRTMEAGFNLDAEKSELVRKGLIEKNNNRSIWFSSSINGIKFKVAKIKLGDFKD
jgi:hypothetical protein